MFRGQQLPPDNYPDDYESSAYQAYRPYFRPGLFLTFRYFFRLRNLVIVALLLAFLLGGAIGLYWILPTEPQIVVVIPPTPTIPAGPINGDFPANAIQQQIRLAARVDHALSPGDIHAYRFFVESGQKWTITVYSDGVFDPLLTLYNADGLVMGLNDDISSDTLNSQLTVENTSANRTQYAITIQSAGDGSTSGGYTLSIMPAN